MNLPNLDFLKNVKIPGYSDFGTRLHETLKAIVSGTNNTEQQANLNPVGHPIAPPQVNQLHAVSNGQGLFSLQITDNNKIYRGIRYYVEHDTDPQFGNPHPIALGDSRTHHIFLGNGTFHFRAYSAYPGSGPSSPVYMGTSSNPTPVVGGGTIGAPTPIASQGSGTGAPGTGLNGPGKIPFRGDAPPQR